MAVSAADPSWPDAFHQLLHDLSGAFTFGFRAVGAKWESVHEGQSVTGYVVTLEDLADDNPDPLLELGKVAIDTTGWGSVVHATVNVRSEALASATAADRSVTHIAMATLVGALIRAAGIADPAAREIEAAWTASPPTLAITIRRAQTARVELAAPVKLDDAPLSEVNRLIAGGVKASGTKPGNYSGDAAKALDRDVLAPAALAILNERLAKHDADGISDYGLIQMERALDNRARDLAHIERSVSLQVDWDPIARYHEVQHEGLVLRRTIETAIEAALRLGPTGSSPIDRVAWVEILAAAHSYLGAALRSESIHHQVSPTILKISSTFEITTDLDGSRAVAPGSAGAGRVYDLNMESYGQARAAARLTADEEEPVSDDAERVARANEDVSGAESADDRVRAAGSDVDEAMASAYGVSATDLITTLFALAAWPLNDADPDAVATSRQELTTYLVSACPYGDQPGGPQRVEAALQLLTSTAAGLLAVDWKPWQLRTRQRRLLVQPLVQRTDAHIIVAPHTCLATLAVYRNYLDQGQLPWSQPEPPEPVASALSAVRDVRNRALEDDVAQLLRRDGWTVIDRVKEGKHDRLGVPILRSEIDVVAGRLGSAEVWLIEVKDPVDTYVVPEIRRHLDTFYVDRPSKPSYATQLQMKFEDLAPHAALVAKALGLPPDIGAPYEVRPLFVTRRPVAAAFVSGPFAFSELSALLDHIGPT